MKELGPILEELYNKYNDRKYVPPDPLQFLFEYDDLREREIVALVASSLAYGHVKQITRSIKTVLDKMPSPYKYISKSTFPEIKRDFKKFKYRFIKGEHLALLLIGAQRVIDQYGSLENCFMDGFSKKDESTTDALSRFVDVFTVLAGDRIYYLLPTPTDKSACKRLNLFVKWMVRKDNVDPGGWSDVPKSKLVMPVDVHIRRICYNLGFTKRKSADMKMALEITRAFREYAPDDPTKYDFALTRLGMKNDEELIEFYKKCGVDKDIYDAG